MHHGHHSSLNHTRYPQTIPLADIIGYNVAHPKRGHPAEVLPVLSLVFFYQPAFATIASATTAAFVADFVDPLPVA